MGSLGLVSTGARALVSCLPNYDCKGAGPDGAYGEDDLDDEEYYPEDEVDPDNMTYEVCC